MDQNKNDEYKNGFFAKGPHVHIYIQIYSFSRCF